MLPRWRPFMRRGFAGVRARYPVPRRGAELQEPRLSGATKRAGKRGRQTSPALRRSDA